MKLDINQQAFFALLRAGLWEEEVRLLPFGEVDYKEIYRLANEQSVIGIITAGLEHVVDVKVPKKDALTFIGSALLLEQRNTAMNNFLIMIMKKFREVGVDSVLIKGQGVAQCYERPLWRSCGDVDLLMNDENYEKGKAYLERISGTKAKEYSFNKEYNTHIQGWCLELHGSLRCGLSAALNKEVDDVQKDICDNFHVRFWEVDNMKIPLPEVNDDVIVIFTHFVKHFYKGGLGIKQICDWCRLLWTYRAVIDKVLLQKRLNKMGLMSQWNGFGAFAVDFLGMPEEAMPLHTTAKRWSLKAEKICEFVLEVGNLGHNVDDSYYRKYPLLIRKTVSMFRLIKTLLYHSTIFPLHSFHYLPHVIYTGLKATIQNGSGYKKDS